MAASANPLPPANADRIRRKARAEEYPHHILYVITCFVIVVAVFQLFSRLHSRRSRGRPPIQKRDPEETDAAVLPTHRVSLRRLPLAILNAFRIVAFRWTLQLGQSYALSLADVFLAVAYIVIIFTWTFMNTSSLDGKELDPKYWCNRAGTIAASQFPVITILGTKNNIVSLLTSISYEKLNFLHRVTARVIFVLIWVHASGKFALAGVHDGDYHEIWFRTGLLASSAFCILCIVSLRPIRAKNYELFFYTHFAMVLIILVGSYVHTKDFKYDKYLWPSLLLWALDRVLRLIRLFIFNNSYFGLRSGSGTLDGSTELVSSNLVRLTLRRPPHFHWSAGQSVFLIMPTVSGLPFEAHPFTIASIEGSGPHRHDKLEPIPDTEKNHVGSPPSTPSESTSFDTPGIGASWNELVFLINVRKGFTKRLATTAAKNGTVKVFIDGPYGSSADLGSFDTCVLIAGGSGVSYTLPVLLDIFQNVRKGTSRCQKAVFIWAIRDPRHLLWISSALSAGLQKAPSELDVAVRIYVTQGTSDIGTVNWDGNGSTTSQSDLSVSHTGAEKSTNGDPPSLLNEPCVTLANGRPDLGAILKEEAEGTRGRMSVSVCGPESVARTVRSALQFPVAGPSSILKGGASITLHVESFGCA